MRFDIQRRLGIAIVLIALCSPAAGATVVAERWTLQSSFWVSLHETLLHAAQVEPVSLPDGSTAAEQDAWNAAVDHYRAEYEGRWAVFDDQLIDIGRRLSTSADGRLPEELPAELRRALESAAPVYRRYLWPEHDRAARFWIAVVEPMLEAAGPELVEAHEAVYGVPFPGRIRVDVAPYAGRYGAYTTRWHDGEGEGAHVRVSALDPTLQGFSALETMLHEPSHAVVGPHFGAVGPELATIAERLEVHIPGQLWHAILFETSGELTRRALARRGVTGYTPYAQGMFEGPYRVLAPLMPSWRAHLDGEIGLHEALQSVVRAWGERRPAEG